MTTRGDVNARSPALGGGDVLTIMIVLLVALAAGGAWAQGEAVETISGELAPTSQSPGSDALSSARDTGGAQVAGAGKETGGGQLSGVGQVGGTDEITGAGSGPMYLSILDVVGKLLLAVLVAYGLVHAVRWWQRSRGELPLQSGGRGAGAEASGGPRMRLEQVLSLGADGHLYLVEIDERRVLLATGEGGVEQVADLTDSRPTGPSRSAVYRSVRERENGTRDELRVAQAEMSTRPVRPDVVAEDESWEDRRNRLLRELQEQ